MTENRKSRKDVYEVIGSCVIACQKFEAILAAWLCLEKRRRGLMDETLETRAWSHSQTIESLNRKMIPLKIPNYEEGFVREIAERRNMIVHRLIMEPVFHDENEARYDFIFKEYVVFDLAFKRLYDDFSERKAFYGETLDGLESEDFKTVIKELSTEITQRRISKRQQHDT